MTVEPLKVLVVDDELPLRQELRAFPWDACDAVLVGEAEHGEEALKLCDMVVPDVVITDIAMPVMDGLTFIRELRKRHPLTQVILLTCHGEFQYAREAIRMGALEYILKVSMDEEELRQALDKARDVLARDRSYWNHENAKKRARLARDLKKRIQEEEESPWTDEPGRNLLQLEQGKVYRLIQLIAEEDLGDQSWLHLELQQAMNEMERKDPHWITWLFARSSEYYILYADPEQAGGLYRNVTDIVKQLNRTLAEAGVSFRDEGSLYAVVSEPFGRTGELKQALHSISAWKRALFYDKGSRRTVFVGKPVVLSKMSPEHIRELDKKFGQFQWNVDRFISYLHEEFSPWCIKQRIEPDSLKKWLLQWQIRWLQVQDNLEPEHWNFTQLSQASTLERLVSELVYFLRISSGRESSLRAEIRLAKQWIRENLKRPLTLAEIAFHAGLSPQYLSRLFREETGESVHQYMTRLRMERAAELLRKTNLKVYEVAEEVGIPNYRHFTVTFRNWSGTTPTEFKYGKEQPG